MKYRKLGNSGILVSSLSLGTMQFGRAMKMGSLGQDETDRMIHFAIESGINLIDTADVYSRGESERFIGAALRGIRDRVSDPGAPYPKWMVLQLDEAEDPRRRILEPNRPHRKDLRGARWSSEP